MSTTEIKAQILALDGASGLETLSLSVRRPGCEAAWIRCQWIDPGALGVKYCTRHGVELLALYEEIEGLEWTKAIEVAG